MKKKLFFVSLALILVFQGLAYCENVVMNVVATNSSDEPKQKMPIRQDLPKEIKKEDIVDAGGMDILYDEEKTNFYLYAETDLNAKESKNYKIVLKDVWHITAEQTDFLKNQAEQRLKSLEGTPEYENAKLFAEKIDENLEKIKNQQETQKSDVGARIDSFRVNTQFMSSIRQQVALVDDFKREAERYADIAKENRVIKFIIEAKNPSDTEAAEQVEIFRYLPEGVKPDQIVDTQGFDIKYDPEKTEFYLIKNVDFKPAETKKFEILIQDIWHIPEEKLDTLQISGEEIGQKLGGSQYSQAAAFLVLEIKKNVSEIKETQAAAATPVEKVAAYSANIKKVEAIRQKIDELRRMNEEMDKAKSKKLTEVIKSVTPDVATTWKLIYAAIGFLAVISVLFFFLWFGQTKAKQGQKYENQEAPKQ